MAVEWVAGWDAANRDVAESEPEAKAVVSDPGGVAAAKMPRFLGECARLDGVPRGSCPYEAGPDQVEWEVGWMLADALQRDGFARQAAAVSAQRRDIAEERERAIAATQARFATAPGGEMPRVLGNVEGWCARLDDVARSACPFAPGSDAAGLWVVGWENADAEVNFLKERLAAAAAPEPVVVAELPAVGAIARHHSGGMYRVEGVANLASTMLNVPRERLLKFPVSIIFRLVGGSPGDPFTLYTRPWCDWRKSFVVVPAQSTEPKENT